MYTYMEVSVNGGTPDSWLVYKEKSHLEMDDDWRYPHFRKPPDNVKSPFDPIQPPIITMKSPYK